MGCGDGHFDDNVVEPLGNFVAETPFAGLVVPPWLFFLHDFSTVDDADVQAPQTRLKDLSSNNPVIPREYTDSFIDVYNKFVPAAVWDKSDAWAEIADNVDRATLEFRSKLGDLEKYEDEGWSGKARDEALNNLRQSLPEIDAISSGARAMEVLVDAWSKTIASVYSNIVNNMDNYQRDLDAHREFQDEVIRDYNSFARKVMNEIYAPAEAEIAAKNLAFTQGGTQEVGGTGPGGPFGGGGGGPSGGGRQIPDFRGPTMPEYSANPSTLPASADPGLTDPVGAASDAAQNALGPATDAASKAAEGGRSAGPERLPEGALGLGPNGVGGTGAGKGGAGMGAGKAGGGAGAKPPPRGLASGRSAGVPAAATANMANATRAAAAGAGLGGAPIVPPPGAPGAGQRGDAAAHTPNKALRRKKNGQKLAGEADAVVPVDGAPEKRPMAEGKQHDQAAQADEPDRGDGGIRAESWAARRVERATSPG